MNKNPKILNLWTQFFYKKLELKTLIMCVSASDQSDFLAAPGYRVHQIFINLPAFLLGYLNFRQPDDLLASSEEHPQDVLFVFGLENSLAIPKPILWS